MVEDVWVVLEVVLAIVWWEDWIVSEAVGWIEAR
jgi:hypothetical protein